MSDELDVLADVSDRLEGLGLAYMLTGSFAANFYAVPRMTRDINLVIELDAPRVAEFVRAFTPEFYCDQDMIKDAVQRKKMFNLIHHRTVVKIDFIVKKDAAYRRAEFERRRPVDIAGRRYWIVSPEDLVLSKMAWGKEASSEMQIADVRRLLESVAPLDQEYLNRWINELELSDIYREVKP